MITLFEKYNIKNYNIADKLNKYYQNDINQEEIYKAIDNCSDLDVYSVNTIKHYTALQFAINKNDVDIVEYLLKKGANPNQPSIVNLYPLFSAVDFENIKIVKLLIEYGANPNIRSFNLETPLLLSFKKSYIHIIEYLLPITDWTIVNKKGYDIFDYMDDNYKKKIIKEYPEKYEKYLREKEMKKFNI